MADRSGHPSLKKALKQDIMCTKYGCQFSVLPSQHKNEPSFLYLERCSLAVRLESKEFVPLSFYNDHNNIELNAVFIYTLYTHILCIYINILVIQSSPTATFVSPGRSMRVKFTTARETEQMFKVFSKQKNDQGVNDRECTE